MIIMGVDPGLADVGVAVIDFDATPKPKLIRFKHINTKKCDKKERVNLRMTNDDQRRYKEIWKGVESCVIDDMRCVGIECYNVAGPQGARGAKTLTVYGGVQFWAWSCMMNCIAFLPYDVKKRFVGRKNASKLEIEKALIPLVDGLSEALDTLPKGKREHVSDAAALAYLAWEETEKIRRLLI